MKKVLALLLALIMVLGLAACAAKEAPAKTDDPAPADTTNTETTEQTPADATDTAESVTIKIWFHGSNVTPEASEKVMAELNPYLNEKIGVTLDPIWGTWGDFDTSTVTALAGGDDVDIYFTCNWSADEYNKYARDGYWVKLDDMLEKDAPELLATIPEGIWECARTNGLDGMGSYAVPGLKDTATQNCWDVNGTLLAELGYDVDAVCAAGLDYYSDEYEEMLQKAKDAKGGDFYPLLIEPAVLERLVTHTSIVTGDLNGGNVLSYYYDAEHPSKDIGSTIVFTQSYAFGCELDFSKARGIDVRMVPATAAYMDCTSGQGAMMAISATSKNPDKALQFLNLLNTDPVVMTYVNYGVEGFTYNKNDDGTITFIDDARATYSPWTNGVGNVRILPPTSDQGADFWQRFSAYYDAAETLPYGGFIFDSSVCETEAAALANVWAEYAFNLMSGAVNPDDVLPEFLSKLEAAGINTFVDAANEQMNAYLAG